MRMLKVLLLLLAAPGLRLAEDYKAKEYVPDYVSATDKGAARDSLFYVGHGYRQWIYDQNFIANDNSNLDPGIVFLDDGRIRSHPDRVYFYNEIVEAVDLARATGKGLAFYLFDHTCSECLFILPQLYGRPDVVEASKDFVNCYVELPRLKREATGAGMTSASLTVQFFLPGMRRLRVVDNPDLAKLMKSYEQMTAYIETLTDDQMMAEPRQGWAPNPGGY